MSSDQRKDQEFCEKHQEWYVPHVVPCQGCVLEAEAHWRQCEDHNIRVMLGMPDA